MANKIVLDLNLKDWGLLESAAKKKGKPNTRELIESSIAEFAKKQKSSKLCTGNRKKKRNNYPIPDEYQTFFNNLACLYSTNPSAIVYRFVILPLLIKEGKAQEILLKT